MGTLFPPLQCSRFVRKHWYPSTHAVTNRFNCLADLLDDVDSQWSALYSILTESARSTIEYRSHISQLWLSENTFHSLKQKLEARLRTDHNERRRLHGIFKAKAKADSANTYITNARWGWGESPTQPHMITVLLNRPYECSAGGHCTLPTFTTISKLDGSLSNSINEVIEHRKEHFSNTLNFLPVTKSSDLNSEALAAQPDIDINTDEPSLKMSWSNPTSL